MARWAAKLTPKFYSKEISHMQQECSKSTESISGRGDQPIPNVWQSSTASGAVIDSPSASFLRETWLITSPEVHANTYLPVGVYDNIFNILLPHYMNGGQRIRYDISPTGRPPATANDASNRCQGATRGVDN
ncbi:hypothetical protein ACLKA6_009793 [Drosophila palustris]